MELSLPPLSYHWLETVQGSDDFEKLVKALGYSAHKPFQPPSLDEIPEEFSGNYAVPANLPDAKLPRAIVFPRIAEKPDVVVFKLEQDGRPLVAVWWDGDRPTLHFRFRGLETSIDCTWASGLYSAALFTWEPGRIAITYATSTESGGYEQRTQACA